MPIGTIFANPVTYTYCILLLEWLLKFLKYVSLTALFVSGILEDFYKMCGTIYLAAKLFKPGMRPAHAWFLRIALSVNVGMHVCVCIYPPPRLLITIVA